MKSMKTGSLRVKTFQGSVSNFMEDIGLKVNHLEVTARVLAESVPLVFGTRAPLKRALVPTACRAHRVLSTLLSTPKRAQIQKS